MSSPSVHSARQIGKQRRYALDCEILEQSHWFGNVAITEMDHRKMKGAKTPSGHNFHQLPAANQLWLHDRRQLSDACTVDKCSRKAYIFVDCKQRLKLQGTLILAVGVEQSPSVPGLPKRESKKAVREQFVGRFRRTESLQVPAARH